MLQQRWNVIAEGSFGEPGMLDAVHIGIVAAGEMHHPAAFAQQHGQQGAHHAVQPQGSLTAAHHHQQRTRSLGHPVRQCLGLEKAAAHRRSSHDRLAAGDAPGGGRQTDGHLGAGASQQPGHPAGDGIGFMQHHRNAAPAGPKDGRGGDVAPRCEHHIDAIASNQPANVATGRQQAEQLNHFLQAPPLQAASLHGGERVALGNQGGFEPIRYPEPAHGPAVRKRIRNR